MITRLQAHYLALTIHIVLDDHMKLVKLYCVMSLAHDVLASRQYVAEGEGAWDLDSVEVREGLKGPDTGCTIERC